MKYDHLPKTSGVYKITNIDTQKIYIGSSKNIRYRISRHAHMLTRNIHHSPHLQNAWNKFGEDRFEASVIETIEDFNRENILRREQYYLDTLRPFDKNGYNTCKKAGSPDRERLSKSHRNNISKGLKGTIFSDERRRNLSKALKGRKFSDTWKEKQRQSHLGKKQSEECILKRAKEYSFIDENGTIYIGKNLKRFAEEHKLHRFNLAKVLSGERFSHHGFRKYIQPTI